jgi:hypothetical protein
MIPSEKEVEKKANLRYLDWLLLALLSVIITSFVAFSLWLMRGLWDFVFYGVDRFGVFS